MILFYLHVMLIRKVNIEENVKQKQSVWKVVFIVVKIRLSNNYIK